MHEDSIVHEWVHLVWRRLVSTLVMLLQVYFNVFGCTVHDLLVVFCIGSRMVHEVLGLPTERVAELSPGNGISTLPGSRLCSFALTCLFLGLPGTLCINIVGPVSISFVQLGNLLLKILRCLVACFL